MPDLNEFAEVTPRGGLGGLTTDDQVDVGLMSKGTWCNGHPGISISTSQTEADAPVIATPGFNSLIVDIHVLEISDGTWKVDVCGAVDGTGIFGAVYDGTKEPPAPMTISCDTTGRRLIVWRGIPDWIKIVATLTGNSGIVAIQVQPLNL